MQRTVTQRSPASRLILGAVCTALLSLSSAAFGVVVDLEDNAFVGNPTFPFVDSQGFRFTEAGGPIGVITAPLSCGPDCADNGTKYLYGFPDGSVITMSAISGQTFDLESFDAAELFTDRASQVADTIELTGNIFGGGTISQTVTLDGIVDSVGGAADFQTFLTIPGFENLLSVVVTARNSAGAPTGWVGLDNIVVSAAVPEPATVAITALGLVLIGRGRAARRRAADVA